MKGSVTLSSMAHVAVLAWGLFSLSGPKPLMVTDVEALPIDIVPIEETTRAVQGEKKADLTEKPAPTPTERPQTVPEARNVGDTDQDARSQRLENAKAGETERSEAPPPSPEPAPSPEVEPDPIRELAEESEPAPTTELAALNEPPVPVTEEPAPESEPAETASE
ncbi:MAG: hypothetical protein VYD64_09400, partial [Pseudomonadota bacterium]|nr:hypothetical protein [Pseudomonadota bacterium]